MTAFCITLLALVGIALVAYFACAFYASTDEQEMGVLFVEN